MKKSVIYTTISSPIGPLTIASTDQGLCFIAFGEGAKAFLALQLWCRKWLQQDDSIFQDDASFTDMIIQFREYFDGKRFEFHLPLDIHGTPFQKAVWDELRKIPYGETRSYKEIAMAIDAPKAVRAIGGANHHNPIPIIVPCHRVIGSNGALVGYGGGLSIKEQLLSLEKERRSSSHS